MARRVTIGSAWVELHADGSGLRREIREKVTAATDGVDAKVGLHIDSRGLRGEVRRAIFEASAGEKIHVGIKADRSVLNEASRAGRQIGDSFGRELDKSAEKGMQSFTSRFNKLSNQVTKGSLLSNLSNPFGGLGMWGKLTAAAVAAAPAIAQTAGSLSMVATTSAVAAPALLTVAGAFGSVYLALGPLKAGLTDHAALMDQVRKGTKTQAQANLAWREELGRLNPQVAKTATLMLGWQQVIKRFDVKPVLTGLDHILIKARNLIPTLSLAAKQLSGSIGQTETKLGDTLGSKRTASQLKATIGGGSKALTDFGSASVSWLRIFLDLAKAATPMLQRFAHWVADASLHLQRITDKATDSGRLERFFKRAGDQAALWGKILGNISIALFNIFHVGGQGNFVSNLEKATASFAKWSGSAKGIEKIHQIFDLISRIPWKRVITLALAFMAANKAIQIFTSLLGAMKIAVALLSAGPLGWVALAVAALAAAFVIAAARSKTFREWLKEKLVPALKDMWHWISEKLWPAILRFAEAVAKTAEKVLRPLIKTVQDNSHQFGLFFKVVFTIGQWLFKFLVPILLKLVVIFAKILVNAVRAAISVFGFQIRIIQTLVGWFKNLINWVKNVGHWFVQIGHDVSTVWNKMANGIKTAGENIKKWTSAAVTWVHDKVISVYKSMSHTVLQIMDKMGASISGAWNKGISGLKIAINAVIGVLDGVIHGINWVITKVGIPKIPDIPKLATGGSVAAALGKMGGSQKFATGGMVTGPGSETSDSINARLSRNEFVIKAKSVKSIGVGVLDYINKFGMVPKGTGGDMGHGFSLGFAGGGSIGDKVNSAKAFVTAQRGKPYVWASAGPNGYDCSGLTSAVYNILVGRQPYQHTFSTGNEGDFFKPGKGTYTVGWANPGERGGGSVGHTAGNLSGMAFEATPPAVLVGSGATSVDNFARIGHLPEAGDNFIPGGSGGNPIARWALGRVASLLHKLVGAVPNKPLPMTIMHNSLQKFADALPGIVGSKAGPDGTNMGSMAVGKLALTTALLRGATKQELLALFDAGYAESGMQNLAGGDRDSQGFLQQRPSQGWNNATSVSGATTDFMNAMRKHEPWPGTPGLLAQAVQRSAFPERYDQQTFSAMRMLKALGAPGFTRGGEVVGSGNGDTVAGLLTPGERVLSREQNRDYKTGDQFSGDIKVQISVADMKEFKDVKDFFDNLAQAARRGSGKRSN